ncbi:unnamed protein product [Merluccius merluccius]
MSASLRFLLILTYLKVAGSPALACLSLHLPSEPIRKESGESASIPCGVLIKCKADHFQFTWFVFNASGHRQLDLIRSKYTIYNYTLTIDPLSHNDSGDYICAVVGVTTSEYQQIGHGTTIVVRGSTMEVVWHILLWLLFTLLTIYNLALMIIIFRKKVIVYFTSPRLQ